MATVAAVLVEAVIPASAAAPDGEASRPKTVATDAGPAAATKGEGAKREAAKPAAPPSDAKADVAPASPAKDAAGTAGETQASVQTYCANIAVAATDARVAWQSKRLLDLETRIKARAADLDAKQAELKAWFDKRDATAKEVRESLVGIYTKMKPETAAAQISALDDDTAVAVLAALSPAKASAIFNEIPSAERAAKLAGLLVNPAAGDKKL